MASIPDDARKTPCRHPKAKQVQGEEVPRLHGTWRSKECLVCKKIQLTDHYGKLKDGKWIKRPDHEEDPFE